MSQTTGRHEPRVNSGDEDVPQTHARPPEHKQDDRTRRPLGQPADDVPVSPDEPDEPGFELIGDDDLSPGDLGPVAPNVTDPDADSGRIRKITR
jgi:hypothetical protein